ncbi:MAG TPA: DUF1489 domain-containing protein [Pedomonas sp.]|uniref:DUF1489 family protein n=1 Tax=Pedomonas sp. TaxID=2976421 RepID=UPI002F40560F
MTVHLIKMAVGIDSLEELQEYQRGSARKWEGAKADGRMVCRHRTRHGPKREAELLDGGSLYWVIKRQVTARQAIVGFEPLEIEGQTHCIILLDPDVIPVLPQPRRPHQGWRYLEEADAPMDLGAAGGGGAGAALSGGVTGLADLPPALLKELRALCLV